MSRIYADQIAQQIERHVQATNMVKERLGEGIERAAAEIISALQSGKKLLLCGNGGSAADAQHLAAEFTGRFVRERRPLAAIALTTDTSAITAIGNDYGMDQIFARQVEALAQTGDVLLAISTSGNSPNVIAGVAAARHRQCRTIGLLGKDGGALASAVDRAIIVPVESTARIQEMHILIGHIWCELVDQAISGS